MFSVSNVTKWRTMRVYCDAYEMYICKWECSLEITNVASQPITEE